MMGYRKLTACLAGIISATIAVGCGWVDGAQYVTVMGLTVGGFLTANTVAKSKA
jgi:hypothetical protein